MSETYYDILSISPDASEEEIKEAFRKIAIKYHPDKNPDDKAEEIFRKAHEAYLILKDHRLREIYDKKNQKQPPKRERFRRGTDLKIKIKAKREDLIQCKKKLIVTERKGFCPDCNGTGSANKKLKKCIYCDGTGLQGFALVMGNIRRCLYCEGAGWKPDGDKCPKCKGTALVTETVRHEIILNPISRHFKINRLGNCCFKGKPGDLFIDIDVKENPLYKTNRLDVSGYIKITPAQAVLGDIIHLTVFNKNIEIKILPGTQHNATIKVKNGGITYKNETGSFYVIVKIKIPLIISKEEKEIYMKIFNIEKEIPCQPKILSA